MWLIHCTNRIKHALRVLPVIAAVAKVSCKHGLWRIARVNRICLKCIPAKLSESLKFLKASYDKSYDFDCHYFFLHFNKNAELVITSTEPALCTRAPTMGFRIPVMASTIAIKFKVIEKVMFSLMVVIIRLERAIR